MNLTEKPPSLSKKQKKLQESYFLNEFSMEFVGKNKMSPAEKRVMHARICMVCTIYAFYHCVNSFFMNDMSGARIALCFASYSGFLAKDGIEMNGIRSENGRSPKSTVEIDVPRPSSFQNSHLYRICYT